MKSLKVFMAIAIAFLSFNTVNAQEAKANLRNFDPKPKSATFKVYGECGMCKHRIENALKINGIKSANWDVDSKMLTVKYVLNDIITNEKKIHELVAAAGHDTDLIKAQDGAYNSLPGCCKYQRPTSN
jgi:periplasmic mercuric ion binding protein